MRGAGLLQEWRDGQRETHVIGRVAACDEQLGSCAAQIMMGDQVPRQFETESRLRTASVALPCAVDRRAIVVDGGLHVVLFCGQPRETKIDEAVAGLGLPEAEEVVVGLLRVARIAECLCEQKFVRALARRMRQGGAESDDGLIGMTGRLLPPAHEPPSVAPTPGDATAKVRKRNNVIAKRTAVIRARLRKVKVSRRISLRLALRSFSVSKVIGRSKIACCVVELHIQSMDMMPIGIPPQVVRLQAR